MSLRGRSALALATATGALAIAVAAATTHPIADWTRWGGPDGDFSVRAGALVSSWPDGGPPVRWRREIGEGYASVLHREGVLYTAARDADDQLLLALDAASGETIWVHRSRPEPWPEMDRQWGLGPHATPLLLGDRLLAVDIGGRLRALDAVTGAERWVRDLPADFGRIARLEEYGHSASPLPYRGTAIVLAGGDRHAVVALDPVDGALLWGSEPGAISYGPPSLMRLAGRDHFLYFEPAGLVALDPATGATLWRAPIARYPSEHNGNHLTPPVRCDDRHLWVGSQWPTGGGRLLAIDGDGDDLSASLVWHDPQGQTAQWTVVRVGDHLYGSQGTNRSSRFAAVDWRSGEVRWRERGLHKTQVLRLAPDGDGESGHADGDGHDGSVGDLLMLTENGELALARASPGGLDVRARAAVLAGRGWTIPTLVGTTVYLRENGALLAVDLGKASRDPRP